MRFQFQLEGLLHVRYLLERQAQQRLNQAVMRIRSLENSLADAERWGEQAAQARTQKQLLPACELLFVDSVLHQSRQAIVQGQLLKEEEEQRASTLRATYLKARHERKTVSTLRDNALRQFQAEQSRREQSRLDDMFLGKLVHARNTGQKVSALIPTNVIHDRNLT
jgi:flagellar export protein FliJ